MSGYIGGILILSGCFMYGLSYSQRLKNRIIILKDMVRMLSVMNNHCLLYTSPSPRDVEESRMPSSA